MKQEINLGKMYTYQHKEVLNAATEKNSALSYVDNRPKSVLQEHRLNYFVKQTTGTIIQKKENKTALSDQLRSGIENLAGQSGGDAKTNIIDKTIVVQPRINSDLFRKTLRQIPSKHGEVDFNKYRSEASALFKEYDKISPEKKSERREKLVALIQVMLNIQFHELSPEGEQKVDELRAMIYNEIDLIDSMPEEDVLDEIVHGGMAATSQLLAILKTGAILAAEKDAKKFSKTGGVGRDLIPPRATFTLSTELNENSKQIISLLTAIKMWTDTGAVSDHQQNLIFQAVGRCMRLINLITDGVNKAEANVRVWIRDGNESETDGVLPMRHLTLVLMPIWRLAETIHTTKKRGYLAAPIGKRKEKMGNRSYAALRGDD
jgi:hypothetical protein